MHCKKCGKELKSGASFCGSCGAPVESSGQYHWKPAPSQFDREPAPSQYDREPAETSQKTPQKKKHTWATVLLVLCLVIVVSQVVSSIVQEKMREDYLASLPEITPVPSMEAVTLPSPFWESVSIPPAATPTATAAPTTAPTAAPAATAAPTSVPTAAPAVTAAGAAIPDPAVTEQDLLTTGIWVLYSPQTTDAEAYAFYPTGEVDRYYLSVMDGIGARTYMDTGTYTRTGDNVHISAGGIETDARFQTDPDKLWFEAYNGPVEITCYFQRYETFPDYNTLVSDGDIFRQNVG